MSEVRIVFGVYDKWGYFTAWLFETEVSAVAWIDAQPDRTIESKVFGPEARYHVEPLELLP